MSNEKCPCSPNHCDKDNLNCGRGRDYFGETANQKKNNNYLNKDESTMTLEEKTFSKIRACDHFLHHSDKEVNLNFLTDLEKQELINILSKCLDNWK